MSVIVPPTVTITGQSSVVEGNVLSITCQASNGHPQLPNILWFRGTQLLFSSSSLNITTTSMAVSGSLFTTTSVLTIPSAVPGDSGLYVCRTPELPLNNPVLMSISRSINVVVQSKYFCYLCINSISFSFSEK